LTETDQVKPTQTGQAPHTSPASEGSHERLAEAQAFVTHHRYTHIILSDSVDIEYLSGFRSSNVHCLVTARKNILFSDFRYKEAALAFCKLSRTWKFSEIRESDFSFFRTFIPKGSVAAYQSDVLTVDQFATLRKILPDVKLVKLHQSFAGVLQPKTEPELQSLRQAAAIGDRAFDHVVRTVRAGMTEIDVARIIENRCRTLGSEKPSFDTIVLFGRRAALPHGQPSGVRLAAGDWVLCDFGCTVNGFCSDMTRTFVMGKASSRQKRIYDIVLRAQESGKNAVAAGVKACDVDARCRSVISKAGFGKQFGHATGHGVGRRIHESPRISKNDTTILRNKTVITIEPGIYIPSFGGVRIEDMVIVRDVGCEVMTHAPRTLIEAGGIR